MQLQTGIFKIKSQIYTWGVSECGPWLVLRIGFLYELAVSFYHNHHKVNDYRLNIVK